MPLWEIYANSATFLTQQKQDLARAVTQMYVSRGLPAFYVNVVFIELGDNQVWVGGVTKKNFVRIVIQHIARHMPGDNTSEREIRRTQLRDRILNVLAPFITSRPEIEWEHHIFETPRDLWWVQGIDPPPMGSEAEKTWIEGNKAVQWK